MSRGGRASLRSPNELRGLADPVAQQLARLLHFLMTGERLATPHSQNFLGHPNFLQRQLGTRVDDLMDADLLGLLPLSTPTHRRGFIDPVKLVGRLAERQRQGVPASRVDFITALMRIAPQGGGAAVAPARKLGTEPLAQALRYALGEEVKVGDRELLSVAQRIRGLTGANYAKPRSWLVGREKLQNSKAIVSVKIDRSVPTSARDPVAALEREAAGVELEHWFEVAAVGCADEGSISYYATIAAGRPRGFRQPKARSSSAAISTGGRRSGRTRPTLRPFLDSTATMGVMATLQLAVALAGKEPGQTAVAVDVLVQSCADGRLDAKLLAQQVAELVAQWSCRLRALRKESGGGAAYRRGGGTRIDRSVVRGSGGAAGRSAQGHGGAAGAAAGDSRRWRDAHARGSRRGARHTADRRAWRRGSQGVARARVRSGPFC